MESAHDLLGQPFALIALFMIGLSASSHFGAPVDIAFVKGFAVATAVGAFWLAFFMVLDVFAGGTS